MTKIYRLYNKISLLGAAVLLFSQCQHQYISATPPNNYQLVWSDEFEKEGQPNAQKWGYDYGDGCPNMCGWGNNEAQFYTRERTQNARVENGHLVIEAHREDTNNQKYTSARLVSKYKGDWLYGRFEIRAKLPTGLGTWPAIWMLPTDWEHGGWPHSGEIDIMEHVGYLPDSIFGSAHTLSYHHSIGTQRTKGISLSSCESAFHVYAVEWDAEKIQWLVDGKVYFVFQNEHNTFKEWPFDKRFHLILNIAIGGNWGAVKGIDDSIFPQKMEVDYVRVYQKIPKK